MLVRFRGKIDHMHTDLHPYYRSIFSRSDFQQQKYTSFFRILINIQSRFFRFLYNQVCASMFVKDSSTLFIFPEYFIFSRVKQDLNP